MSLIDTGEKSLSKYADKTEKISNTLINEMIKSKNFNKEQIKTSDIGVDLCIKNLKESLVVVNRTKIKTDKYFEQEQRMDGLLGVANERKNNRKAVREKS